MTPISNRPLDDIRASVLDSVERSAKRMQLAMFAAAALELLLFAAAFYLVDWHHRVERLMFVLSVLSYTIVVLGLFTLGAHVTRTAGKLVAALAPSPLA